MIDQPQQEKEEQLRGKEKQRWDKLEEEERTVQAKNERTKGEAAPTTKHKASIKNKTNKAAGDVNSDRQSKPSDSNPSPNTRTSEHEEIALLFRMATDKLDQVEANAEKEKQQIVRDLARELEKFRPIDRIVEELRKKVSKSVIYAALDERYKTSYRVQNARKRKRKKENKTGSLAPTSELKPLVVDRSGHSTQQLVSETYSSDAGDDDKPQDSEPVNINEKQKVDGNTDTNSSPPVTREVTECEHCQLKDSRIKELEDIVEKIAIEHLVVANQIAEGGDDNIKQLQNELDELTPELSDKTSQIDKLSDDLKRIKEKQAEVHKDENPNLANVDVSKTGDFEFSLFLGDIKYCLAALYPRIGDAGKVWFSGKLDKESGRIFSIRFGRLDDNV